MIRCHGLGHLAASRKAKVKVILLLPEMQLFALFRLTLLFALKEGKIAPVVGPQRPTTMPLTMWWWRPHRWRRRRWRLSEFGRHVSPKAQWKRGGALFAISMKEWVVVLVCFSTFITEIYLLLESCGSWLLKSPF